MKNIITAMVFACLALSCEEDCNDGEWKCKGDTLQQCFEGYWEKHTDCSEFGWVCCDTIDEADCLPVEECEE